MKTHIVLLRGINVSGQKLIKMEDLRKAFADAGFPGARTLIQSGNIVVRADGTHDVMAKTTRTIIADAFGFEVEVIVLSVAELREAVAAIPFDGPGNKVFAVFLSSEPPLAAFDHFNSLEFGSDCVKLMGQVLYIHYGDSAGTSKLTINLIEKKLGVTGTARNVNTCRKLLEVASIAG